MSGISFNSVPNTLVPFTYTEFDNSKAEQGSAVKAYTILAMGQKVASGSKAELEMATITSESQAKTLFGEGSMLHLMCRKYLQGNKVTTLKAIAIDDLLAGVLATGNVLFAGAPTADGILYFYIGGEVVNVSVSSGDAPSAIATALVAAITAASDLPISAAVNGGTAEQVDFTALNKGEEGNSIDLRFNYNENEELPTGLTETITPMASGAGNPDIADIIAVLPEDQFDLYINPWLDAANLTKLESELGDRFAAIRQNDGYAIGAKQDSFSNMGTLGDSRNSKFTLIMPSKGPSMPYEWAAATVAAAAKAGELDQARPFQTLELVGIKEPVSSDKYSWIERDIFLKTNGIATWTSDSSKVRIEALISTYKRNDAAADDTSYKYLNTMLTLSFLRWDWNNTMKRKFPRHKLVGDSVKPAFGQSVITPSIGKAEAIAKFREWEEAVLVENVDQFIRDLVVIRSTTNANRLDFLLPPDLANQLRVVGTQIGFLL